MYEAAIKALQEKHFLHTEDGKTKLNKTTAENQLNSKLDEDGIIRCYGGTTKANLSQETMTPILLPRKEKFVELTIEEYNKRLLYTVFNHTLSQIRTKYWIVRGRAEVKIRKTGESREEKGMGLLIHLRCCEGHPPRNCRRSNSEGVLVITTGPELTTT